MEKEVRFLKNLNDENRNKLKQFLRKFAEHLNEKVIQSLNNQTETEIADIVAKLFLYYQKSNTCMSVHIENEKKKVLLTSNKGILTQKLQKILQIFNENVGDTEALKPCILKEFLLEETKERVKLIREFHQKIKNFNVKLEKEEIKNLDNYNNLKNFGSTIELMELDRDFCSTMYLEKLEIYNSIFDLPIDQIRNYLEILENLKKNSFEEVRIELKRIGNINNKVDKMIKNLKRSEEKIELVFSNKFDELIRLKKDFEFIENLNDREIHCEISMIKALHEKHIMMGYIGVSLKCCPHCFLFINNFNHLKRKDFRVRGVHIKCCNWNYPNNFEIEFSEGLLHGNVELQNTYANLALQHADAEMKIDNLICNIQAILKKDSEDNNYISPSGLVLKSQTHDKKEKIEMD